MNPSLQSQLDALQPRRVQKIMDLVDAAGVDVKPWGLRQDGTAVKNASANPSYCYEWAFGGGSQPAVVCVWHRSLSVRGEAIVYEDNLRSHALELDRIATEPRSPPHVKSRARDQARRARSFDMLLQRAYRTGARVHVVLLDGNARASEELGWERSEVRFRELDGETWKVEEYSDSTGDLSLVRGGASVGGEAEPALAHPAAAPAPTPLTEAAAPSEPATTPPQPPVFVDQFSLPQRHATVGTAFDRSAKVRREVLERAQGACELCNEPGFVTASGAIFLETHHVVALSDDGPDEVWNVVAVCPNDHRRAHFDEHRDTIQTQLQALLVQHYPAAEEALDNLGARRSGFMPAIGSSDSAMG